MLIPPSPIIGGSYRPSIVVKRRRFVIAAFVLNLYLYCELSFLNTCSQVGRRPREIGQ